MPAPINGRQNTLTWLKKSFSRCCKIVVSWGATVNNLGFCSDANYKHSKPAYEKVIINVKNTRVALFIIFFVLIFCCCLYTFENLTMVVHKLPMHCMCICATLTHKIDSKSETPLLKMQSRDFPIVPFQTLRRNVKYVCEWLTADYWLYFFAAFHLLRKVPAFERQNEKCVTIACCFKKLIFWDVSASGW